MRSEMQPGDLPESRRNGWTLAERNLQPGKASTGPPCTSLVSPASSHTNTYLRDEAAPVTVSRLVALCEILYILYEFRHPRSWTVRPHVRALHFSLDI